MANSVTQKDIQTINRLYYQYHNKARVARETGFSAGTVSKYIVPGWTPPAENVKHFNLEDVPEFTTKPWLNVDSLGQLCVYSVEEKKQIEELWKELEI